MVGDILGELKNATLVLVNKIDGSWQIRNKKWLKLSCHIDYW